MRMCELWRPHYTSQWGGGHPHWVSMCTVWPSHSKWLSRATNLFKFCFKLEHSSMETIQMIRNDFGDDAVSQHKWKCGTIASKMVESMLKVIYVLENPETSRTPENVDYVWAAINEDLNPGDSAPLQPRFGTLWLLDFPKTKITFEREEISDCWWHSRKYDREADGYWENCEVPRDLLWRGLRSNCLLHNVP